MARTLFADWYLDPQSPPGTPNIPAWLLGPAGQQWLRGHGWSLDEAARRAIVGVKSRFPLLAPPDALAGLGLERGIDRGQGETDAIYAQRVVNAWTTWPFAGTANGILQGLYDAGYPNVWIAQANARIFTLDANRNLVVTTLPAGGWKIDYTASWSKFQVIFAQPLPTAWIGTSVGTPAFVYKTHGGSVALSGTPTAGIDYRFILQYNFTADFKISTDGGRTFDSNVAVTSPYLIPGTGITFTTSGSIGSLDAFGFQNVFNVPSDGSDEANRIKTIVNRWKPAAMVCTGYVIATGNGSLLGLWQKVVNLSPVVYLGGNSSVVWTP